MQFPNFLRWLRKAKSAARPPKVFGDVIVVKQMSAVPDALGRNFYVVQRQSRPLWAVFDCPCNTGHVMRVNLSSDRKPYWSISRKRNTISLSPSIWLQDLCHSHYWIQGSRVYWSSLAAYPLDKS
jgi:hypothetical protein